jgi:pyrroline-5-carboxylate reductase
MDQIKRIAFIGGGNMASALIGGLLAKQFSPQSIVVAEPDAGRRSALQERYAVQATAANLDAAQGADVLILAVKPNVLPAVCRELRDGRADPERLIISIAAGVRCGSILRWLGGADLALVRAMPNTPALVQQGVTGLYANPAVTPAQRATTEQLLSAVGTTVWFAKEELLDAVTAVSGSGPAYFFRFMEAMERAAIDLGLDAKSARALITQTALGSAVLVRNSDAEPAELRRQVTSPGGTTERGLAAMDSLGIDELLVATLQAAKLRAEQLAAELDED